MNTLLDLMHQVWRRRISARPSAALASAVPPRRTPAGKAGKEPSEPASDLWAWYQSRCTAEADRE